MVTILSRIVRSFVFASIMALTAASSAYAGGSGFPAEWDETHVGTPLDTKLLGKPTFNDKFNTYDITTPNGTDKWYAPVHAPVGIGTFAVPPNEVYSVTDGLAHLQSLPSGASWINSNIQSMNVEKTAQPNTRGFVLQDGYFESKIKFSSSVGTWGAFWLRSLDDPQTGHAEVDVIEYYGKTDSHGHHTSVHIWPAPSSGKPHVYTSDYSGSNMPDMSQDFHTYGALLLPDTVIIYFDRIELKRIARPPELQVPFYILMSMTQNPNESTGQHEAGDMQVSYTSAYPLNRLAVKKYSHIK